MLTPLARSSMVLWLALGGASACTEPPAPGGSGETSMMDTGMSSSTGNEAMTTSTGADSTGGAGHYHPDGFANPDVHGLAAKMQDEDCRNCHGSDLTGSPVAASCDACHAEGWRSNCTYCHGGDETDVGAPPRDIDGSSQLESLSFRAHTAHVIDGTVHGAFDCVQCHTKPTDVLSVGHMFDDTHTVAEVDFSAGLSAQGQEAAGQCGTLYCHGNGNGTLGAIVHTDPAPDCGGCHAYTGSPFAALNTMSGEHARHINVGIACSNCHPATVNAAGVIVDIYLHVNGTDEVMMPAGITYDTSANTCVGICHDEEHSTDPW